MARLGPPFWPPRSPEKVYVYVPLLRSFPGNEAHKLFSGGPKWGVLGGDRKVYVEKVYVLFLSLTRPRQTLFAVPALRELESACRVSIL